MTGSWRAGALRQTVDMTDLSGSIAQPVRQNKVSGALLRPDYCGFASLGRPAYLVGTKRMVQIS
jgi:hypothetical protein